MIPPYNHNLVLPPFIGDVTLPVNQSPYPCEIVEFCHYFSTSPCRISILKGLVAFRLACVAQGIRGRQWIDGSFVENIEKSESRDPNDVDVLSLIYALDKNDQERIVREFPEFVNPKLSKKIFHVDHYHFTINMTAENTIACVKYWNMLFSHNRRGVWKGMLEIPLYPNDVNDRKALEFLNTL